MLRGISGGLESSHALNTPPPNHVVNSNLQNLDTVDRIFTQTISEEISDREFHSRSPSKETSPSEIHMNEFFHLAAIYGYSIGPMAPSLKPIVEALEQAQEINGQLCTHTIGKVIYGPENLVRTIADNLQKLHFQSPVLYETTIKHLSNREFVFIAMENSSELAEARALGAIGRFQIVGSKEFAQSTVGALIETSAEKIKPPRTIAGIIGHEALHMEVAHSVPHSLGAKMLGNRAPLFMADPCKNIQQAVGLTDKWLQAFNERVGHLTHIQPGTVEYALFNEPLGYYKSWQKALSDLDKAYLELKGAKNAVQTQKLLQEIETLQIKAARLGATFRAEIPTCLMDAKIDFGNKATLRGACKELGKFCDELLGKKIFLDRTIKQSLIKFGAAASDFMRKLAKPLLFLSLKLDIEDGVRSRPKEDPARLRHGTVDGLTQFVASLILMPIDPYAQFADYIGTKEIFPGAQFLFPWMGAKERAQVYGEFKEQLATIINHNMDQYEILKDLTMAAQVLQEVSDKVGGSIEFPKDFFAWSDEKRAAWGRDNIAMPAGIVLEEAIERYKSEEATPTIQEHHDDGKHCYVNGYEADDFSNEKTHFETGIDSTESRLPQAEKPKRNGKFPPLKPGDLSPKELREWMQSNAHGNPKPLGIPLGSIPGFGSVGVSIDSSVLEWAIQRLFGQPFLEESEINIAGDEYSITIKPTPGLKHLLNPIAYDMTIENRTQGISEKKSYHSHLNSPETKKMMKELLDKVITQSAQNKPEQYKPTVPQLTLSGKLDENSIDDLRWINEMARYIFSLSPDNPLFSKEIADRVDLMRGEINKNWKKRHISTKDRDALKAFADLLDQYGAQSLAYYNSSVRKAGLVGKIEAGLKESDMKGVIAALRAYCKEVCDFTDGIDFKTLAPMFDLLGPCPDQANVEAFLDEVITLHPHMEIADIAQGVLQDLLQNNLRNFYSEITKGEPVQPLFLKGIQDILVKLYSLDPNRSEQWYQTMIDICIIRSMGEQAQDWLSDWRNLGGGVLPTVVADSPHLFDAYCKTRQPFIDFLNKKITFSELREHSLREYENAVEDAKENIGIIYQSVFTSYADNWINEARGMLGAFFQSVGKDLIHQPTFIPGLTNFHEEDLEENSLYSSARSVVEGLQLIDNFDGTLIPSVMLLMGRRFNHPLEQQGILDVIGGEKAPSTAVALGQLFTNQAAWSETRNIQAFIQLFDTVLNARRLSGVVDDKRLLTGIDRAASAFRAMDRGTLSLMNQALPGVFAAVDKAFQDVTGRRIEDRNYYLAREMTTPLLGVIEIASTKGRSYSLLVHSLSCAYHGYQSKYFWHQSLLWNAQEAIERGKLDHAERMLNNMSPDEMRADDQDLHAQLKIGISYSKAIEAKKQGEKKAHYKDVIEHTDRWLEHRATSKTSTTNPNLSTLMKRGFALLFMQREMSEHDFNRLFSALMTHFEHRGVMPHQLLAAHSSQHKVAKAIHEQLERGQESSAAREQVQVVQLSTFIEPVVRYLGYEREVDLAPIASNNSSLPVADIRSIYVQNLGSISEKRMQALAPVLFNDTLAFCRGEMPSHALRWKLRISYSKYLESVANRQQGEKVYLSSQEKEDDVYIEGWVAFLLEWLDFVEGKINAEQFQNLMPNEIKDNAFIPPFSLLYAELLGSNAKDGDIHELSKILNLFHHGQWDLHLHYLLLFSLAKNRGSWTAGGWVSRKGLCRIIREIIGSRVNDQKLVDVVKTLVKSNGDSAPPFHAAKVSRIRSLLAQGASPDQVFSYKVKFTAQVDEVEMALADELPHKRLLHRLAELGHWDIIDLFSQFGADFHVGNLYDMNALEHMVAKMPKGNRDLSKRTIKCMKTLIDGGISPNSASSGHFSYLNAYQGASPLFSWFPYTVETLAHTRLGWIGEGPKKRFLSDYTGWNAKQIAIYKGLERQVRGTFNQLPGTTNNYRREK